MLKLLLKLILQVLYFFGGATRKFKITCMTFVDLHYITGISTSQSENL